MIILTFVQNLFALSKLLLLVIFNIIIVPFFVIPSYFFNKINHHKSIQFYFYGTCKILGIKISATNAEATSAESTENESVKQKLNQVKSIQSAKSVLFVTNHISYLDIMVLGFVLPVKFTPKAEIAKWPVISFLTKLSKPIFIDRDPKKALIQREQISKIVKQGHNIIIFPESTTSDGRAVLPFKSSLFAVAEPSVASSAEASKDALKNTLKNTPKEVTEETTEQASNETSQEETIVQIQPITICYKPKRGLHNLKQNIGKKQAETEHTANKASTDITYMDKFAWYGDMEFMPHFWQFLKTRGVRVHIKYHNRVKYSDFGSRKELSKFCQNTIAKTYDDMLKDTMPSKKSI